MQTPTAPVSVPLRAIERQMPGRPALPGTDIPGAPMSIPGTSLPPTPGLPDTPFRTPMPGVGPDTGETVPRPMTPDTNIPDTGETVPRPHMPDPGAPATPNDESGFADPGGAGDAADTTTLVPVPAPA